MTLIFEKETKAKEAYQQKQLHHQNRLSIKQSMFVKKYCLSSYCELGKS